MTQRSERGDDQSIRYVTLGCARGGKARIKSLNVATPRPTGKTDCKARINALKVDGKMRLTTVHNTHNHGLSPNKSRFFRCNRKMSETVKKVLDTNDLAGIRMNKSFGSLVIGAGGFENLPFLEKDCRNYIDKARHLRLGAGGAGALRDYFLKMQYKNNGFFALMDLSDDGRLKNIFWADPRSRAAYQYFGDVFTFDTTYLKNRYGMPFAPFVSVNHHRQSILLGAGLISSENTETFTLLFQTWLQCMDGIPPKAIITDQGRAMKNVIANVFPESRSLIEKRFQELYTNAKFREVQQQVMGVLDMDPCLLSEDGVMKTYLVEDEVCVEEFTKLVSYIVNFNVEDCDAKFIWMITYAAGSNEQFEDAKKKLYSMIDLYRENQHPLSMTQTGSNAGFTTLDTNASSSKPVLSPNVV
ncbi:protein FAR-RED IMPAIRED RESPONSE 1-like [Juglans regia]|uniref:Protein FAR-RED IMPAIRED RESPONSE 1-like n=1 Tax=Juglans regia TaxID=51240 RepID=A0A6P9ECV5_JUGRE|nr:protein FAR-RED IMPAIRED RESPONSE 1-like [Juglans regia]